MLDGNILAQGLYYPGHDMRQAARRLLGLGLGGTLAYLIERQQSAISGRDFIRGLLVWADVATGRTDVLAALDLPMHDFEDALQTAAAMGVAMDGCSTCCGQFFQTIGEYPNHNAGAGAAPHVLSAPTGVTGRMGPRVGRPGRQGAARALSGG